MNQNRQILSYNFSCSFSDEAFKMFDDYCNPRGSDFSKRLSLLIHSNLIKNKRTQIEKEDVIQAIEMSNDFKECKPPPYSLSRFGKMRQ